MTLEQIFASLNGKTCTDKQLYDDIRQLTREHAAHLATDLTGEDIVSHFRWHGWIKPAGRCPCGHASLIHITIPSVPPPSGA